MSLVRIGWPRPTTLCDMSRADDSNMEEPDRPSHLGSLPTELKLSIIEADPDAALALMDTTHEFEMLVCHGPLRSLFEYFEQSPDRLRSFLQAGIRSGKTAGQFVRLAEVFHTLINAPRQTIRQQAQPLVELGMLTPRIYNAMCPSFLQILCESETLTFSFSRRFPLLSESELDEHPNMLHPYADEHEFNHISELDIVLLRVAPSLGEQGLLGLAIEQLFDRDLHGRDLIKIGDDRGQGYGCTRKDSAALTHALKRYFCAIDLRVIDANSKARDGALYRTAFGLTGSSSARRPSTPSAPSSRICIRAPWDDRRQSRSEQRFWLFQMFRQI